MKRAAYVTVAEIAARWNYSPRRVREWCRDGTLKGAQQFGYGGSWRIPAHYLNALTPADTPAENADTAAPNANISEATH